ncbi:MAG TPA: HAD hydrolase family protein [Gemmatimonadaceae bacterium]|nr:HAD hydrolase family protein [Gemmatimonadaceae bacterium]
MIDRALAKRIRLIGLDVDGVLTDGGLYIGDSNGAHVELKRYDIQDGLGVRFLRDAGIRVCLVTGRVSESVRIRANELEIDDVAQDALARKLPAFQRMLDRHDLRMEDAAFVGDDFPDMGIMRAVGLPIAVANAVPEIKAVAQVCLTRVGGRGAVRECAELLLKARGDWDDIVERYVAERSAPTLEVLR